jgi:Zn finger protein HypA/HybF involved in hydrogenase expression
VTTKSKHPLSHFLVKGKYVRSATLKAKLIKTGTLEEICSKCGLGNVWDGEALVLHLDHIDGDHKNNLLENLRLLCPNCHSQTSTYAGRNNRKHFSSKKCQDCNTSIDRKSTRCRKCAGTVINKPKRKVPNRPSASELTSLLEERTFVDVGKLYGVSDNAIRNWCKSYGIPSKRRKLNK